MSPAHGRLAVCLVASSVACNAFAPGQIGGDAFVFGDPTVDASAATDATDAPAVMDAPLPVDVSAPPVDVPTPIDRGVVVDRPVVDVAPPPRDTGMAVADVPVGLPGDPATRTQPEVCARWNADVAASQGHGGWTPGAASCDNGTLPMAVQADALRMLNAFRYLAGLTPVGMNAHENDAAQACAVLIQRNGMLNHTPPMSWTCWSALGYEGTSHSNITGGGGGTAAADAIANWIDDSRDISGTLGHRRWMLFPPLGDVGYGQATSYACLYVLGGRSLGSKPWVAWPNEGVTPVDAVTSIWSFSSARLGLSGATVAVTRDGSAVSVSAQLRAPNYGDPTLSWTMPAAAAGSTYHVTVSGSAGTLAAYDVRPVRCR